MDNEICRAADLLAPGERALALKTAGFALTRNGNDWTSGNWVVRRNPDIQRVIVYLQQPRCDFAEVYIGDYAGQEPSSPESATYKRIFLANVRACGVTRIKWTVFVNTRRRQSGVAYVDS
jgi:hypothetical protein